MSVEGKEREAFEQVFGVRLVNYDPADLRTVSEQRASAFAQGCAFIVPWEYEEAEMMLQEIEEGGCEQ